MRSHFSFLALALSFPLIFSADGRPAGNSRVNVLTREWSDVLPASTLRVEVPVANAKLDLSRASAQRVWDCQISGQVRNARGPIPGVTVTLTGRTQRSVVTDREGRYRFENLQPGTYRVKFSASRFIEQTRMVTLQGTVTPGGLTGEKRLLNVSLTSAPSSTPRPSPSATALPSPAALPTATRVPPPSPRPSANPSPTGNSNQGQITNVNTDTNVNTNTNVSVNANTSSPSLDDQINALVKGKIVYDIPAVMQLGTSSVIKIGIAKKMTEDVTTRVEREESTTVQDLRVNDVMDVDLISEKAGAFEISRQQPRAELPGWQAIGGDTASEWIFNVTPRQSGTHKLRLVATVLLNDPKNQNQPKSFNVYENDISVSTNYFYYASEFIKGYWQFLLTTLLLPAGALVWRVLKSRSKPPEPPQVENPKSNV